MPYNPGSAYPKKTTYVPHSHPNGLGINGAVNATKPLMAPTRGGVTQARSAMPLMDARAAAASQIYHGATAQAQAALQRRGVLDDIQARQREQRGLKQNQAKPAQAQPAGAPFSTDKDRPTSGRMSVRGNPFAAQTKTAAEASMDTVVDTVLQSPSIGAPGTPNLVIPKWENGRRR